MENDIGLLDKMMSDSEQQSGLYKPGPFWYAESLVSAKQMREQGIQQFRGRSGIIGQGYTDSLGEEDPSVVWACGSFPRRILKKMVDTQLFRRYILKTFTNELRALRNKANMYEEYFLSNHLRPWFEDMRRLYTLPESTVGGVEPESTVLINDCRIAKVYLEHLARIYNMSQEVDLTKVHTMFEIGGGFGATSHLLLSLYPNIRKLIYLDVPPMLYVGTQYLRHFYPKAVKDYRVTANMKSITFSPSNDLEILAIAPWQIERVDAKVDLFWNSASFQEIPVDSLRNYSKHIVRLTEGRPDARICLIVYPTSSPLTVQSSHILESFDGFVEFKRLENVLNTTLDEPYYYFVGSRAVRNE